MDSAKRLNFAERVLAKLLHFGEPRYYFFFLGEGYFENDKKSWPKCGGFCVLSALNVVIQWFENCRRAKKGQPSLSANPKVTYFPPNNRALQWNEIHEQVRPGKAFYFRIDDKRFKTWGIMWAESFWRCIGTCFYHFTWGLTTVLEQHRINKFYQE